MIDTEQLKRWANRLIVHTLHNPEAAIVDRNDSFTDTLEAVRKLIAAKDTELDMYAEQMLEGYSTNESSWYTTNQGRIAVDQLLSAITSDEDTKVALSILRSDRL